MRQLMELILVCFHLSYEVDEVFRFLESIQVLCIDNIPELVLNLDHEFDNIEAVEAVVAEDWFKGDLRLLGRAEIVLYNA